MIKKQSAHGYQNIFSRSGHDPETVRRRQLDHMVELRSRLKFPPRTSEEDAIWMYTTERVFDATLRMPAPRVSILVVPVRLIEANGKGFQEHLAPRKLRGCRVCRVYKDIDGDIHSFYRDPHPRDQENT